MRLSPKQAEVYRAVRHDDESSVVLALGPIRSGKSVSALSGFWDWCWWQQPDDFLIGARSAKQLAAVVVGSMKRYGRANDCTVRRRADHWELANPAGGVARYWPCLGGKGQEELIEGMTFGGGYVDDALFWHRDVVGTVADRCSAGDHPKVVMSGWPQSPQHWFKGEWYDKIVAGKIDGSVHHFALTDNPGLSARYIRDLKERWRHAPHEYRRRILGQWAAAGGLVVANYADGVVRRRPSGTPFRTIIGCDWGSAGVSYAVRVRVMADGTMWADREWAWDHADQGQIGSLEQAARIDRELCAGEPPWRIYVDPSADGLLVSLVRRGLFALPAVNDVKAGTDSLTRRIGRGQLKLGAVPRAIDDLGSLSFDEDKLAIGQEVVDKATTTVPGAHAYDALRYAVHSYDLGVSTGAFTADQRRALERAEGVVGS